MQRALGASEPPGTPAMNLQASSNRVSTPGSAPKKEPSQLDQSQKKNISTGAESKASESPLPAAPQKKQTTAEKQPKDELDKGPEGPGPGSKTQEKTGQKPAEQTDQKPPEKKDQKPPEKTNQKPAEKKGQKPPEKIDQKPPEKTGQKPPDQTHQAELKKIRRTSAAPEESKGFFGFGGANPQQDTAKPAESLGGKMFGLGSSIFSSASTLINSAVQDEQNLHMTKETPPRSSPLPQTEKASKDAASPVPPKVSTCPLCKVKLNFGSKEPPNYKNCTECQKTVCVQCGFNPAPNMSEVRK